MGTREDIINSIIGITSDKYPDWEVYLYGSRARGDANKLSDWDLLILLNSRNISFETETKLMDDFYELELDTGEIISPLIYSKNDWYSNHTFSSLYENIQKEGYRIKL